MRIHGSVPEKRHEISDHFVLNRSLRFVCHRVIIPSTVSLHSPAAYNRTQISSCTATEAGVGFVEDGDAATLSTLYFMGIHYMYAIVRIEGPEE